MIKKILKVDNFAVFNNYKWDAETTNVDGNPLQFEKINIIYGRNYSGKTTLSRLFRSLETKQLPDNYDSLKFEIIDEQGNKTEQDNLLGFSTPVRVFNEDFVKSNLKFLFDSKGEIASFAILGENNKIIENEIAKLTEEIGDDGETKTGLFKKVEESSSKFFDSKKALEKAEADLETLLSKKATDKKIGIKYKSERFGDVNYNIAKLKSDIETISNPDYQTPTEKEVADSEATLNDSIRPPLDLLDFTPRYLVFKEKTVELLRKEVGNSNKIQRLLYDAALNSWVKKGVELADNAAFCPFCGGKIEKDFWAEIHAHFDEESRKLENDIVELISQIEQEINNDFVNKTVLDKQFYSEFSKKYSEEKEKLLFERKLYNDALQELVDQLKIRTINITVPVFVSFDSYEEKGIIEACNRINSLIVENNSYANHLSRAKKQASTILRLLEVENYCETIGYNAIVQNISDLCANASSYENEFNSFKNILSEKQTLLEAKKCMLNDEEKGAQHVNEYLNDYFGHHFVKLVPQKEPGKEKQVLFQIMRNGKPAYNLSEGECSLIAFCYFMAKLDDINTAGKKPIIWIDDPISSLDNNHIYFLYSLIDSRITKTGCFSQLFISTHNLDFLKYLNRLNSFYIDKKGKSTAENKAYFMVERNGNHSIVKPLPNYLKNNATEYNYLFSQIYKVANCAEITDDNYDLLYSFGNTARKFLEIYLYFKYPSNESLYTKLEQFFSPETIPTILINRLINEDSHGPTPENSLKLDIDPETVPVAKKILQIMKEKDIDQYNAFEKSI